MRISDSATIEVSTFHIKVHCEKFLKEKKEIYDNNDRLLDAKAKVDSAIKELLYNPEYKCDSYSPIDDSPLFYYYNDKFEKTIYDNCFFVNQLLDLSKMSNTGYVHLNYEDSQKFQKIKEFDWNNYTQKSVNDYQYQLSLIEREKTYVLHRKSYLENLPIKQEYSKNGDVNETFNYGIKICVFTLIVVVGMCLFLFG